MQGLQRVGIRIANQGNTRQYAVECLCKFSPCLSFIDLVYFIYFIFLLKGVILPYVRHSGEPHPLTPE